MKIKLALEIDMTHGAYALSVDSPTHPGAVIDAATLRTLVGRVMDNMVGPDLGASELPLAPRRPQLLN